MTAFHRFIGRLRSDGSFLAVNLALKSLLGIDLVNVFNAVRFRDYKILTSCDLATPLPPSTVLPHPVGVVIGHDVEMGKNVRIQQNVTLGRKEPTSEAGYPTIGSGVRIGAGSAVVGDVEIGDGAVVGANAVVNDDVPPGATVVGVPARET